MLKRQKARNIFIQMRMNTLLRQLKRKINILIASVDMLW